MLVKADTTADPLIEDAIGKGYMDTDEVYTVGAALPTHDVANKARVLIGNSARRRNLSAGAWVTDADGEQCLDGWKGAPPCADKNAPHLVKFKLWSKFKGRVHVYQKSGGDPANLKYNPWNRPKTRKYDDHGNPA